MILSNNDFMFKLKILDFINNNTFIPIFQQFVQFVFALQESFNKNVELYLIKGTSNFQKVINAIEK